MHDPLADVLTESLVVSLGGPRSFERGVAYLKDGMVGPLPADALTVYRRHVEEIIGRKDKRAYEHAVEIMRTTVRALFAESGRPDEFPDYVAEVRGTHKPKRNLMKLMASLP